VSASISTARSILRPGRIDVETVKAASTITLLEAIEALYPMLALIHVFLDNARYHHVKLVQDWLARPECRSSCISLRPLRISIRSSRLWGLMHRNVTHNKTYETCVKGVTLTKRCPVR
jgi:hypothetical protein